MAALHGWQPRLGTGLNIFQNTNNGQSLTLVNTPTEIILEGTAFSPEIMNELEQAIANSEIINFSAAPTASTPGALGQFGAFDGMVYYCTGVSISMSYGALSAGTYYFYAQNLPYSFTLSGASSGLSFNGATLTSGGSTVETHCWPQGTKITMVDNSTYQWTALTPASNTIPISGELAQALGLPNNSTVADALGKLENAIYIDSNSIIINATGSRIPMIRLSASGDDYPAIYMQNEAGAAASIVPLFAGSAGNLQQLNINCGEHTFSITASGGLELDGEPIADFVVEQGTSGIWTYRKYNSGIAECWGICSASYKADFVAYDQIDLPFTFPVVNSITTGLADWNNEATNTWDWNTRAYVLNTSSIVAMVYSPGRGIGASNTFHVYTHVMGRWK